MQLLHIPTGAVEVMVETVTALTTRVRSFPRRSVIIAILPSAVAAGKHAPRNRQAKPLGIEAKDAQGTRNRNQNGYVIDFLTALRLMLLLLLMQHLLLLVLQWLLSVLLTPLKPGSL